jgi:hypothetical protein
MLRIESRQSESRGEFFLRVYESLVVPAIERYEEDRAAGASDVAVVVVVYRADFPASHMVLMDTEPRAPWAERLRADEHRFNPLDTPSTDEHFGMIIQSVDYEWIRPFPVKTAWRRMLKPPAADRN